MPHKKHMPEWILASASPRRKEILDRLGMKFRIDPSHIKEPDCRPDEAPSSYVIRIARMKARETAKEYNTGIIIGADTVVVSGNDLLGKPSSREDARNMLSRLGGRWHEVWSGLCIFNCDKGRSRAGYACSRVHFRRLASSDIEWYLDRGEYVDKAGAYAVQGHASLFIDNIEGCYFNIVGFPIALFEKLCRKMGIRLQDHINV
ncbi:MAG: Maf family protein [Acidobacteriota bacterium]|jgi:septum formation protein